MSDSDVDSQVQLFNEHCPLVLDKSAPNNTRLAPVIYFFPLVEADFSL